MFHSKTLSPDIDKPDILNFISLEIVRLENVSPTEIAKDLDHKSRSASKKVVEALRNVRVMMTVLEPAPNAFGDFVSSWISLQKAAMLMKFQRARPKHPSGGST